MNPFAILLALLGSGLMTFSTSKDDDNSANTFSSQDEADEAPDTTDAVDAAPTPGTIGASDDTDTATPQLALQAVVLNMGEEQQAVKVIEAGATIDFGDQDVSDYTIAFETTDGTPVGSMVLNYDGHTWLQNDYPYTLNPSFLDLSEGSFEVSVSVYSGANGTGDLLGSETISFSTTSQQADPISVTSDDVDVEDTATSELALQAVVVNISEKETVDVIEAGATIDFGATDVSDYTVAFETTDGTPVGSMVLNYEGQNWLQNDYPYTLKPSFLDLSEGTFEVGVSVYSGADGTGDLLGSETISFSTTSQAPATSGGSTGGGLTSGAVDTSTDDDDTSTGSAGTLGATPEAPTQNGTAGDNSAEPEAVQLSGTVSVTTGRVTTLEHAGDDVAGLRVLSDVNNGNVTVNPDNTFALVMTNTDYTGRQNFEYEVTHSDGSTSTHTARLNAQAGTQDAGWATGEAHYMLATDANDKVIVEHGEEHTKVYISDANSALSLSDIARAEGMNVNQVTGDWLASSNYGQSENLALDTEAGMRLWEAVTPRDSETSNWLLFERGHEYDLGDDRLLERDAGGETELNPLYVGAWGTGDKPEIQSTISHYGGNNSNLVIQDIHFTGGIQFSYAENIIIDNVTFTEDGASFLRSESITVRNSDFYDIVREATGEDWNSHSARIQGLFANFTDGVLVEGNFLDKNGWDDGYDVNGDGDSAMPPSMWSQNIYLGADNMDVTLRDTITMRASSFGAQFRSGAFVEDNVSLDNNAAFTTVGGDYKGAGPVGHYTLMADNLVTSAAHKEAAFIGALSLGIADYSDMSTLTGNIVAHLADPNSDELDYKNNARYSVLSEDAHYDDTIVYNWKGSDQNYNPAIINEQNTEGLDTAALDQTTIQNFTAQLLGQNSATIEDLANYLRDQADGELDDVVDADLIIKFFKDGFGIDTDFRDEATTLQFVPNDLADGVRWDNRMNWDTDDLPGLYAADSVDLAGNDVVYGTNATIDELDFGPDGSLNVYGGKLNVDGGFTGDEGGSLNIEGAGQIWVDGSDADDLDITVDGGRFVNTGDFSGADLTVTGGEAILASEGGQFEVGASKTLAIFDEAAKVGFDGDSGEIAILDFDEGSTVAFKADNNDLGTIEEISSSAYEGSNVRSGIDLGKATLSIDLAGLSASNGTSFTLMDADEIVGVFEDAIVGGLGSRNAKIVVDYEADSVTLELTSGNGQVNVETVGDAADFDSGEAALWNALTADQGVYSEKDTPPVMEDEPDFLDDAA